MATTKKPVAVAEFSDAANAKDEPWEKPERAPVSLADAATAALSGGDGAQGEFDETQATKVKFAGMGYDAFEESIKIGDEITFLVRTRCIGVGDEVMKSAGTVRHMVKMEVQSVIPQDKV